jgi:leader peptidase (prepilin peptidase) / N-methyltransferase
VTLLSPTADLWFFALSAFLFGLVFGSFLNVCIYRLPRGMSVVSPRSACPNCATPIAAYDNIPVLSWFLLGGRCRGCKAPISSRYWMVELMTGILFLSCVLRFGLTITALKFCIFCFLTLGLIFTDADLKLLPDAMTIPGIWIGLALAPFTDVRGAMGLLYRAGVPVLDDRLASFINAGIGALIGAGFIFGIGELWYRLRGVEAMGFGDVKLMGMVGAFTGPKLTLLTIMIGSMIGSIVGISLAWMAYRKRMRRWHNIDQNVARDRSQRAFAVVMRRFQIPFGVFLGIGALLSAFFGDAAIGWYTGWLV